MNGPRPYCKIIISGPLNEHWHDYLGDLLVIVNVEEGQIQTTTMIGRPRDLTIYAGMLNALVNLGLTVTATEYRQSAIIGTAQAGSTESARGQDQPANLPTC
jgi:hypothetical protein